MMDFMHHDQDNKERKSLRDKFGDYTGDSCPICDRYRVMLSKDKKRRCEKCWWCIEDAKHDNEMFY